MNIHVCVLGEMFVPPLTVIVLRSVELMVLESRITHSLVLLYVFWPFCEGELVREMPQ